MSKSIYDETISILNSRIADGEIKSFKVTGETYDKITNALEQAQKQEKLLELYKEYFEYSEMLKDGRKFGGRMLVEHERDKVSEEIKELESE